MSRLTRDGTAEPVSRDQILRHARGQGNVHFPCSANHEQDWQPYPVDPYSAICDDHTYKEKAETVLKKKYSEKATAPNKQKETRDMCDHTKQRSEGLGAFRFFFKHSYIDRDAGIPKNRDKIYDEPGYSLILVHRV